MSEKPNKQETLEKIANLGIRFQIMHTITLSMLPPAPCPHRILALEKDRKLHLYSKRHEHRSLYCTLEELEMKLCAERKVESKVGR
jgi:hypothetical protein